MGAEGPEDECDVGVVASKETRVRSVEVREHGVGPRAKQGK